jgi:hypothetical protein
MNAVDSLMLNIRSLLATSPTPASGGGVIRTSIDLSALALTTPDAQAKLMGCGCAPNPSGLSPAEVAAAQAANQAR